MFIIQALSDETGRERSGLDLFFIDRIGNNFKATLFYRPYFYLDIEDNKRLMEVAQHLQKRFETCVAEVIEMEDLDMANHLSGKKHKFLKVSFNTNSELMEARSKIR